MASLAFQQLRDLVETQEALLGSLRRQVGARIGGGAEGQRDLRRLAASCRVSHFSVGEAKRISLALSLRAPLRTICMAWEGGFEFSRISPGIAVQEENSVSKVEYEVIVKKLEKEEEEHAKTKKNLDVVSEQLEFALGEIDVLSKQLQREKQAFDSALSRVNNKVLKQSIQKDKLISKCSEIENHIQKQEDILNDKENEIKELQQLVNRQKQTLKKQASDFKIQKQQENYIAEVVGKKNIKDFKSP